MNYYCYYYYCYY